MANEAKLQVSLQITVGNFSYRSYPNSFLADVAIGKGPTPGAITVTPEGTDIDLSQLTELGFCLLQNVDDTNYVDWGVWDNDSLMFYPVGRLLPGEISLFRLSPDLHGQYYTTGTGTAPSDSNNTFRFKAHNANCNVLVHAFDA